MTDARLPDRWLMDRRLLKLSDAAYRLHVTGLMWSVANRTDGVIGDDDLALLPTVDRSRIVELEKQHLWQRDRDTWLVVDFATSQTSRAEHEVLENARRSERERKARWRAKKAEEAQDP